MRILFVTTRIPGGAYRGDQLRAYQQLMHLSLRHQITLLALDGAGDSRSVDRELAARCERVIVVRHGRPAMVLNAIRALWTGLPLQVEAYNAASVHAAFRSCVSATKFDLIHIQLIRLGTLIDPSLTTPCVLDLVDALSVNMTRRSWIDHGPRRWLSRFEGRRLRSYEQAVIDRTSAATLCSTSDMEAIGSRPNLHHIDNGVDLSRFPFSSSGRLSCELIFVGNLGYFPNVDAVIWFATHVLPLLASRFPEIQLHLVGARPAASLIRLAHKNHHVKLIGPVPDVHTHLARATLAIAPLRSGSGQQLKVLEAMASGTPVVASTLATAGTVAENDLHLLVTDGVAATVSAVSRLLQDDGLRSRLAVDARRLVEARYSWERSVTALERIWLAAAKER